MSTPPKDIKTTLDANTKIKGQKTNQDDLKVWLPSDEEAYKAVIEKYQKEPKLEPSDKDNALVKKLCDAYIIGGNPLYQHKLTALLEIFLQEELKGKSLNQATLQSLRNSDWMYDYLLMVTISGYMEQQTKNLKAKAQEDLNQFEAAAGTALPSGSKGPLSVSQGYFHSKPLPKTHAVDRFFEFEPSRLPFADMLNVLSAKTKEKQSDENQKTKIEQAKEAYSQSRYQYQRALGLQQTIDALYNACDFHGGIQFNPEVTCFGMAKAGLLYPNAGVGDILPSGSPLRDLMAIDFKIAREENSARMGTPSNRMKVFLMAQMLIEKDPKYKGWTVIAKTEGKDPGFILESPDKKQRLFGKYTEDVYQEYYCSKLLGELGIKMSEPILMVDSQGNPFLLTADLSRTYSKEQQRVKQKKFTTMDRLIPGSYAARYENAEQKKQAEDFIKTFSLSDKARISFAKLLIMGVSLGLSDLGGHGGNIGPIITQKGGDQYTKFGIVDFGLSPRDMTKRSPIMDTIQEEVFNRMAVVYQDMYRQLKPEDFVVAAKEIQAPKMRTYSQQGYLLSQAPKQRTTVQKIFESTTESVKKELIGSLPNAELPNIDKALSKKQLMMDNLNHVLASVIEENVKPKPQAKK